MFNVMSQDLGVDGNICDNLDKNFEYSNRHRKILENEYDSQFKYYRDIDQKERNKYINNQLSKLPLHEQLQKLNLNDDMMDFDATSLYLSAMWDQNSV